MSQKQDPRNTPGTEREPSDAFKDALTERAAADVAQSLANGGRVVESVFDDPTVRAALDRVQAGLDENAYYPPGAAPKNLIMKFQMSRAHDADTTWSIDAKTKTIEVAQETIMGNEKSFITTAMLLDFVLTVLPRENIIAYHDETVKSYTPVYADWKVIVKIGDVKLYAVVWKQHPFAGVPQSTIEFFPVIEA